MIIRRSKVDRPVKDRTPRNIIQRPLRLSPMRNIKDGSEEGKDCTCRKPISWHHAGGRVTCIRCRGVVEEVGE